MHDVLDLDANPCVFNGYVDMGAYEFVMRTHLRAFLQGPYLGSNVMSTHLGDVGLIPHTSPYCADVRTVVELPEQITDWVLVELLRPADLRVVAEKSVLLRKDGYILDQNGEQGVLLDAAPGEYYVKLTHRNHCAVMSAIPATYTNAHTEYSFIIGVENIYGNNSNVAQLADAVGMLAGDADGDGRVTLLDQTVYTGQASSNGYLAADFNMDANVMPTDLSLLWANNLELGSGAPRPSAARCPRLSITPPRRSVLNNESAVLHATAAETSTGNLIIWEIAENNSGAYLNTLSATSVLYVAGATSRVTDVIQAWDSADGFGRARISVLDPDDTAATGKAVVLAGRKNTSDPLWSSTDYLADTAFNTLLYKGYPKDAIQYLSPITNQDVDANGNALDDVDLETTSDNAALTFTNWARGADQLFVYLVDHGGDISGAGYFRLNQDETGANRLAPLDTDGDGMADTWESLHGVSSPAADDDSDGLNNLHEYLLGDAMDRHGRNQPHQPYLPHRAGAVLKTRATPA